MPNITSREERLNKTLGKRSQIMQRGLPLATDLGLEISPNWAPLITPTECKDIHYCDILDDQELTQRDKDNPDRVDSHLEVMPLTYILKEGLTIAECAPPQTKYGYIVSSHVLEHVPDFLGMLYQQRNVLKDGGTIAFVLPNFKGSGEYFRESLIK